MMGARVTMADAFAPPGVLGPSERPDAATARLAKAAADPMFARKVQKFAATLRTMRTARAKAQAVEIADALALAEATGADLPTVLEDRGILRRIF